MLGFLNDKCVVAIISLINVNGTNCGTLVGIAKTFSLDGNGNITKKKAAKR